MNLEIGRTYRSRDGRLWIVTSLSGDGLNPRWPVEVRERGGHRTRLLTAGGLYHGDGREDQLDLVEEVTP